MIYPYIWNKLNLCNWTWIHLLKGKNLFSVFEMFLCQYVFVYICVKLSSSHPMSGLSKKGYIQSKNINREYTDYTTSRNLVLEWNMIDQYIKKFNSRYPLKIQPILSSKTTVLLLRSVPPPELLHAPCCAYIFWNNGWILMIKVSKWLYWSAWYDRISFK